MAIPRVDDVVRNKALAAGAEAWLSGLPDLISSLESDWDIRVGEPLSGGTEAYVAEARHNDGSPAVLKLCIPRAGDPARQEIAVLRLAQGRGCVELLRDDADRGALLLERLGTPLCDLGLPLGRRHEILCAAAAALWRPAPDCGLPTGADKGRWLMDFIATSFDELGRPCSQRAVDQALSCAESRIAAHDDGRAVLVHGDIHQWNALECAGGFKLIDPDGLLAEPEYDLGVLMREDPLELAEGDPYERARRLASLSGLEASTATAAAIWEWGVAERVSTGLLCTRIDLQPVGRQMLALADRLSAF